MDANLSLVLDQVGKDKGIGRLGRTAWLNGHRSYRRTRDADDLVMNVESILPAKTAGRVH